MPLYKDEKSPFWFVDIFSNGKRIRRSTGTTDKKDAQRIHDELKASLWKQKATGYTWHNAVIDWLKASERDQSDRYRLRAFTLPNYPLSDLTPDLIMLHIKGADGTINRMINLVKAIFNLAKKNGHIETVIHLEKKKSPEGRIRWLTKEEWERLHEQLPPHLKAMATFAISTGLRQANVLGLEWNQVDMKRNVAWIHPDQAKQKKPIGIPLSKTAMDVLRGEEGKHETFVFTYEGVPVGSVKTAWGKALKRAGLGTWEKKGKVKVFKPNFKWHDLRHTWATWHVQSGTPLEVLQKLGGWSDFKMVLRYAHFAPEYLAGYADNSVPYARQIARAS